MSPGINDPGTAVICLHALSDIFAYRLYNKVPSILYDEKEEARVYIPSPTFGEMFEKCIHPIWNYGKKDAYIQNELILMTTQLKAADYKNQYTTLFDNVIQEVEQQKKIQKSNF